VLGTGTCLLIIVRFIPSVGTTQAKS